MDVMGGVPIGSVFGDKVHQTVDPGGSEGWKSTGESGLSGIACRREDVLIIVGIENPSLGQLTKIAEALNSLGLRFGPAHCWEKESGENGDDSDHDEEFDQSEAAPLATDREALI